eukprot:4848299-Prymnesium_polylepis.1
MGVITWGVIITWTWTWASRGGRTLALVGQRLVGGGHALEHRVGPARRLHGGRVLVGMPLKALL